MVMVMYRLHEFYGTECEEREIGATWNKGSILENQASLLVPGQCQPSNNEGVTSATYLL